MLLQLHPQTTVKVKHQVTRKSQSYFFINFVWLYTEKAYNREILVGTRLPRLFLELLKSALSQFECSVQTLCNAET